MDAAEMSRFPHLSWLGFRFLSEPRPSQIVGNFECVGHIVTIILQGTPCMRRICAGREQRWRESAGTAYFLPADDRKHVFIIDATTQVEYHAFIIPPGHLGQAMEADGIHPPEHLSERIMHDDPMLASCLQRIASLTTNANTQDQLEEDALARSLVRRLAFLNGSRLPDWEKDEIAFEKRTLAYLVEHIDDHLKNPPAASDLGVRVALSPSHFAKKFRQSTGLSLHRFVNRRRIMASME